MSQNQENNNKKKYLIIILLLLLFVQIAILWQRHSTPTPPMQFAEEYKNHLPQALITLNEPNQINLWKNINSLDLISLQNWLSLDNIPVEFQKLDEHFVVTFKAPQGSKPSIVLNKVKLLPKLNLFSLNVKTIDNYREFRLKFTFSN